MQFSFRYSIGFTGGGSEVILDVCGDLEVKPQPCMDSSIFTPLNASDCHGVVLDESINCA